MTYFIDFDHTIFDTTAFKNMLSTELFSKKTETSQGKICKYSLLTILATFLATGRTGFAPTELQKYLYPEVPAFLEAHASEVIIVTYGVKAFIIAKVTSALVGFHLKGIVYTPRKKGHVVKKYIATTPGPWKFIDDAIFQLESVQKLCPHVELYEMRRNTKSSNSKGKWPIIHSLSSSLANVSEGTHA